MATMTDTTSSSPYAPAEKAEPKECTTHDLIEQVRGEVTAAQLEQEITSQKVTALEEHLKQLEEYDKKITSAADDYRKGIGAVCTDLEDLRKTVEQSSTQAECLVPEDARKKIAQILDDLRRRRDTLESCTWELSKSVIEKRLALEQGQAEVDKEEKQLEEKLARLDRLQKEVTDLKDIKQIVDCSDTFKKECRYAFYLDLEKRLEADCPTADDYQCELVEQAEKLDGKRQDVRDMGKDVSIAQSQLDRVTKLRDDLVGNWRDELCRAVTAGSVSPLPDDLATACGSGAAPAGETTTSTGSASPAGQHEPRYERPNGEYEEGPATPAPAPEEGA
jgi:chromosome segregation ATPase